MIPDRRNNPGRPLTLAFFRGASKVSPTNGCWEWLKAVQTGGYGAIRHNGRTYRAHRLAYEVANNCEVERSLDVCHSCDNRRCVNPDHLFIGTRTDNMQDCAAKGRIRVPGLAGDLCPNSKLTSHQVKDIRSDPRSARALAKAYGVDRGTIGAIRRGLTWRGV